ncbi:CSC1-like protein RXW8 isoform X1 [Daucus carota subsp. sativus]|uniref:CSC1-like protein RXW8 isoform X1 n=1 Tax=Daucus carota subsp. sativus TaxID=79200 RepID=UPI0007B1B231|nr:PREDICTED: CSC1-like protein RXW8 isoform X1 [Daucus carota subsp. sativus]
MNVAGLCTSAGINIALCTGLASLYSILRKQPSNVSVYFEQRISQVQVNEEDPITFDRYVPSPSWILRAWETTEEDLLAIGGLDAVVFFRIVLFCIKVFSVAAAICICIVLPLNYLGQPVHHKRIRTESLTAFTIINIKARSEWLWVHCAALYIITFCACVLLYIESKSIAKKRITYILGNPNKLSLFTVLVRAIPFSGESYSDSVTNFFTNYYPSSYLSHQMVYFPDTIRQLVKDAEMMLKMLKAPNPAPSGSNLGGCGLCGINKKPFKILSKNSTDSDDDRTEFVEDLREKECAAALVFFRTRYAALVAAATQQSPNPMLWVTDMAPEPPDVFWANLCVPYKLLWVRKLGVYLAASVLMVFFFVPVSFVQSLVYLDKLKENFLFVRKLSEKRNFIFDMITGYLPSVMLTVLLLTVPPLMSTLAAVEGPVARSGRKISACRKVMFFIVWNVFFSNILSGSVLERFDTLSSLWDIPLQLANGVPSLAVFFMTYILTSGWTGLASELMQPVVLLCHWLDIIFFKGKPVLGYGPMTFPYHTEIPRLLHFGLLGFTGSVTAPLLLPFLMVYFILAYLVYRNQFINVYITKYDTGGLYWPVAHNTIIFSLLLTQVIVLGVFTIKKAEVCSSCTIALIICTLLFHFFSRQRFFAVFHSTAAQVVMEMDRQDENSGRLKEIHDHLNSSYCQFQSSPCSTHDKQVKEFNEQMRSTFGSFKSTSRTTIPKALELGTNRADADDKNPAKNSNYTPGNTLADLLRDDGDDSMFYFS